MRLDSGRHVSYGARMLHFVQHDKRGPLRSGINIVWTREPFVTTGHRSASLPGPVEFDSQPLPGYHAPSDTLCCPMWTTEIVGAGVIQEMEIMIRRADMMKAAMSILSVVAAIALAGCISSHSDVSYGPKGPAVGGDTLRQIECGQTTKGWLLAVLGEPSCETRASNGSEILTYEYTKTVDSDFSFFILFDADDRREERTTYIFEIENGIVTRYWKK